MNDFPNTKFLVWTGTAQVEGETTEIQAKRAKDFFDWVKYIWDNPNDNIFVFNFFELETEGSIYMKSEFSSSLSDSHPNHTFSKKVAPIFCKRITEVIEPNK